MALAAADKLPTHRDPRAIEAVVAKLAAQFGNRLVTSLAVRQQHANTTTWVGVSAPMPWRAPTATAVGRP